MSSLSSNLEECETCACFLARKIARQLTQHYEKYLRPTGLRATQYTLLVALIRIGKPIPLIKLSDILGLERTTLTRNLQHLEQQGFVTVQAGNDKRTRFIEITKAGRLTIEKAYPYWLEAHLKVTPYIAPETLKSLAIITSQIE